MNIRKAVLFFIWYINFVYLLAFPNIANVLPGIDIGGNDVKIILIYF